MNLDFTKVCGKHLAIYETYYKQIDPKGSGAIEAMTAAKFLKKSGLSDVVLSRIWDLSDPNGKGFLDKPGFYVALKLVSLAQAGQVINMSNIYVETANPPKVGEIPKIMPPRIQTVPVASGGVPAGDWSIKVIDRLKYEQLFESLKPVGGMLAGNKVKGVLMDSKLPMDTLGKIWDLADQDKDGNLDKHEFIVAMHLVYQTLEKRTVPDVLPPELRKVVGGGPPPKPAPPVIAGHTAAPVPSMPRAPSGEGFADGGFVADFPKDIAPPPPVPPLPAAAPTMQRVPAVQVPLISTDPLIPIGAPPSVAAAADWVVTPVELKRFETVFRDSDRDKDGLVSGLEVKNVFLQSGVPQNCLAHIWALCDTNQSGKLTLEQFALAMWMVERKQKGIEPPQVLTSNMVPPSMRGIVAGVDLQPQEPKPTYSNPELEMISKEIEELAKERRALETEIAQKEADIRIKSGEVRSLQSELDTLSATLKQLEHQRGEAQKRLDDLKLQSTEYEEALANIKLDISQKRSQVSKIREQCQKQEETINEQEGELNSKRSEMQKLKDEEAALQKEYEENNKELEHLTKHLQNTQLQISSVRSMVTQLLEAQRQMTDALLMCRAAIESSDADLVTEYQLKIEPDFDEARKTLEKKLEIAKSDPFEDNNVSDGTNAMKGTNGFASNGFANDPFVANAANTTATRSGFDDGFSGGFDAFGSSNSGAGFGQQKDPFGSDSFGATKSNAITPEPGKDDFGSDPFAALHAPTGQGQVLSPNTQKSGPPPRPESPSPALPPKKSKMPPPRPAPPRPLQGPTRPPQPSMDAFGASTNSSGFADFADFDNKQASIISLSLSLPLPLPPTTTTTPTTPTTANTQTILTLNSTSQNSLLGPTTQSKPFSSPSSSSSSQSVITSAATTTTTPTFNSESNLIGSNTPPQQAASATSGKKSAVAAAVGETAAPSPVSPAIYGPTDFMDDPFKDYRYEDPFNIKDPFADDNSNSEENTFKDDFSSEDDHDTNVNETQKEDNLNYLNITNTSSKNSGSTSITSQTYNSAQSNSSLSNELLEHFDAFDINASPSSSGTQSGTSVTSTKTTTAKTISAMDIPKAIDDFADFDAFSTKSSDNSSVKISNADTSKNNNDKRASSSTDLSHDTASDAFFDAFNDNFLDSKLKRGNKNSASQNIMDAFDREKNTKVTVDAFGSVTNIESAFSAFDAFVTKSQKVFGDDDFNNFNAFEDDFSKDKSPDSSSKDVNLNICEKNVEKTKEIPSDFDRFDAFADDADFSTVLNNSKNLEGAAFTAGSVGKPKLNKVQNSTMALGKTQNSAVDVELPPKFAADYSNADSFESDLEEAIKRSMVEK